MSSSPWKKMAADIIWVAKRDKKLWLLPLIFILVAVGILLVWGALAGPLAPFVYTLF